MVSERQEDPPLAALRDAWRGVTPPPLADGVEEADPATREVTRWLRAAFATIDVPPAPVQRIPRGLTRRMPLPAPLLAAAAAVLVAVGAWWGMHPEAPGEATSPLFVAGLQELGPSAAGDPGLPEVAALGPEHIELRSGPVRLILLRPPAGDND